MTSEHRFEGKLNLSWPAELWQDVTVLVAVSGGADSVALLRALARLKNNGEGQLITAHFNHGLRAEESDTDESFVTKLSERLGVDCVPGRPSGETLGQIKGEEQARQARYEFLKQTALQRGARYVATAHTIDDQAETVLHRILRGTGIGGLAGIQRVREFTPGVVLVRPLLQIQRSEVIEYLDALEQPFRKDATNDDTAFTRNRIRHELLPHLAREYNCHVRDAIVRLSELAGEVQSIVDATVRDLTESYVTTNGHGDVEIDCRGLVGVEEYLIRELLIAIWKKQCWAMQSMSGDKWIELGTLILAPANDQGVHQCFPGGVRVSKNGDLLSLSRPDER